MKIIYKFSRKKINSLPCQNTLWKYENNQIIFIDIFIAFNIDFISYILHQINITLGYFYCTLNLKHTKENLKIQESHSDENILLHKFHFYIH